MCFSLPEIYRAENIARGHAYDCGYGAGADCDCVKGETRLFIVSTTLRSGAVYVMKYSENRAAMIDYARSARGQGWRVSICERRYHQSADDGYVEFLERAASDMERLKDWATD